MFIARISKGRTVREFVLCALIAPTLVCALWMSTFGGAAIDMINAGGGEGITAVVVDAYEPKMALFGPPEDYPLYSIIAPISLILIVIFFVTSSASGSLVIDTITAGGKMNAPVIQRVFWCTLEGLVAIALLLGGGLAALQGAAVSTGVPFTLVVLVMCYCLWLALRAERQKLWRVTLVGRTVLLKRSDPAAAPSSNRAWTSACRCESVDLPMAIDNQHDLQITVSQRLLLSSSSPTIFRQRLIATGEHVIV